MSAVVGKKGTCCLRDGKGDGDAGALGRLTGGEGVEEYDQEGKQHVGVHVK
ncbi:hypothetical protein [Bartonella machadoae]|uniref:hypothetical protein n=1 Tax=Bartonella machadoae TaxID=2893471 RepID=UPI001F4D0BFF|nr:hypothetical protein [Bartonella machadoae]UNE53917.1 hypothetical protein LNM86_10080 [Bartonella machadoae]